MKLPKISAADKKAGFTVLELLIVMVILAIIFGAGTPIALNFYLDYQLDSEYELLTSLLQQSRNLSMINHNESDHGLYLDSKNFVIFQGSSFATRVQSQDRPFPRSASITVSGPSELLFAALSGATASTTYTLSDGRKSRDVYVNPEGLVY